MFYQHPEIKGTIRNLRQYYREPMRQNVWAYDIYLDDVLVKTEDCHWWSNTREEVITAVKQIGEQLKQQELVKRELAAVGDRLYVKWCTDITRAGKRQGITGFYGIFVKRKAYCIYSTQSLDEALAKLRDIESGNNAEIAYFNSFRDD
ncbi:hypothetical protein [Trichormus variabilis]|uniref:Uncharacterized protein n=1 Tax=Trichormus variabilis SAG 1403-4b TaxID=447716 RepID=A0A433UEP9_ANAVA|nr:hypothetical protein [Trichormus variabilis]MBD2629913.1 hypothetical protein [Trichormus variabilis FACHB-164]RUS92282.1 hypothetical protein DSM107003_51440 [Trichormus variabilis SAG 1403-4b]